MELQRVNASAGERIFMTFRNSDTTQIAAGHWAAHDLVTDQDGYSVDKPAGKLRNLIAGVCMSAVAAGANAKFQVWGINTIAKAKGGTQIGTNELTAGSPLAITTSGFYPARYLTSAYTHEWAFQGAIGYAMGCSTAANYSAATSSTYTVFITCL